MEERDVVASLNELDDLIADARRRKLRSAPAYTTSTTSETPSTQPQAASIVPTPPHLLPPSALLAAHLAPFLNEQSTIFTSALKGIQADNAAIADSISSQRAEIEGLLRGLEMTIADIEGAANTLGASEEMRGVEQELESAAGVIVR